MAQCDIELQVNAEVVKQDKDIGKEFTVYSKDLHDSEGERFFPSSEEHGYYVVKIVKRIDWR
jgi:hypothetical protein